MMVALTARSGNCSIYAASAGPFSWHGQLTDAKKPWDGRPDSLASCQPMATTFWIWPASVKQTSCFDEQCGLDKGRA
jgi:hypothetical protein